MRLHSELPEQFDKVHLTTEVPDEKTAGSKARVDVAEILAGAGYSRLNLPMLSSPAQLVSFIAFMKKRMSPTGHIILEYPFDQRKRAYALYLFRMLTGVKIYALIHDIAALRFKTAKRKDLAILRLFDGLIAHNPAMSGWLAQQGLKNKLVDLQVFDYCNRNPVLSHESALNLPIKILYAGNLAFDKARYVYDSGFDSFKNISLSAYGQYFEPSRLTNSVIQYKGIFDPDSPVLDGRYHFGLVWEGTSLDTCAGSLGDYLRHNSPHKLSLYISLGIPVIIWDQAATARFVLDEGIGITISNLRELDGLENRITNEAYTAMLKKLSLLAPKVKNGDFLKAALGKLFSQQELVHGTAPPLPGLHAAALSSVVLAEPAATNFAESSYAKDNVDAMFTSKPLALSVILPCFNGAETIAVQLDALAAQDWQDGWEVIVVNNGSTDGSMQIVEQYKDRLPALTIVEAHVPGTVRLGVPHSYNMGIKAATGDAFVFCEADDEVAPGWLAAMGQALREHPFVNARLDHLKLNPVWLHPPEGDGYQSVGLFKVTCHPHLMTATGCAFGLQRSLYEKLGPLSTDFPMVHDAEYCWRAQLAGYTLHFEPNALIHYREKSGSRARFRQGRNWSRDFTLLLQHYGLPTTRFARSRQLVSVCRSLPPVLVAGLMCLVDKQRGKALLAEWSWNVGWSAGRLSGLAQASISSAARQSLAQVVPDQPPGDGVLL